MFWHIMIGCGLVVLTTIVHTAAMVGALRGLEHFRIGQLPPRARVAKATAVASLVLVMYIASFVEAGMWAAMYLLLGAISGIEKAMYFSTVTYATLGYGDIVLDDRWRMLSSLEAANGIIMFGWTTALIFTAVHVVYLRQGTPDD